MTEITRRDHFIASTIREHQRELRAAARARAKAIRNRREHAERRTGPRIPTARLHEE